ncbi:cupin domain-containing protein [Flexithrix dorotheae]|uniref:cupin domain-containing protein n=1 Tax=Flexithrix dorotheae TaxID=70993 RepID=UPI0003779384|nr:cupin domain-containing protein [Flexithrix dorotheae]
MEKLQSKVFQIGSEVEWENVGPGLNRQVMGYDDKIMLVKVKFEKGAIGELHEHHHSQVTYVVSGSFELNVGGEKKVLNEGDGFYIPPHVMHGAVCLADGVLIDVFSPHREDFL